MAHPFLFTRGEIHSIKDFADMEIPVMTPNQSGVFVETVYVEIPAPKRYGAVIGIARDKEDGYYASCRYATSTGGGYLGPYIGRDVFHSKEEAFLEGISILGKCVPTKEFQKYLRKAKHEFFKYSHKQLTLF